MKILTLTVILGLPLMALGQTEPQQTQEQTKETQTTAPTKGKKMRPAQEQTNPQAKPETGTNVRGQTNVKSHAQDVNRDQPGMRSSTSTSQTNATTGQKTVGSTSQTTTVNKQEFRSRHTEVFSLGRHPKEFFVQRFGERHFRLIGNSYFVFVDGCWVAVDVDGFVYTERVICAGDPEFIEVD
jgi:cytoskeletal protein RodZ